MNTLVFVIVAKARDGKARTGVEKVAGMRFYFDPDTAEFERAKMPIPDSFIVAPMRVEIDRITDPWRYA